MKINWDKILFWLLISVVVTLPLQVTELLFPIHLLGSKFPVPIERVGVEDRFGESGNPEERRFVIEP